MVLTRDSILRAELPREPVECPDWNGTVWVRVMSGADRERFEADLALDDKTNVRARLAVLTVCDESGTLLFRPEDAEALGRASGKALVAIYPVAVRLNRIEESAVEDLAKN